LLCLLPFSRNYAQMLGQTHMFWLSSSKFSLQGHILNTTVGVALQGYKVWGGVYVRRYKAPGWGCSQNKVHSLGQQLGLTPNFGNVPHLWALPIIKHKVNIIMHLNRHQLQGVGEWGFFMPTTWEWEGSFVYQKQQVGIMVLNHGHPIPESAAMITLNQLHPRFPNRKRTHYNNH
jgi:hypothetical protein